jgi:hypothetical protein
LGSLRWLYWKQGSHSFETLNFKAKDLDSDALLNSRMGFGKVNTSNSRHFDISVGPNEEGVKFRQNITAVIFRRSKTVEDGFEDVKNENTNLR